MIAFVMSIFLALAVVSLLLLHVGVLGYWAMRGLRFSSANRWTLLTVGAGLGFFLLGGEIFVLGHIAALNRMAIYISSILMVIGLIAAQPSFKSFSNLFIAPTYSSLRHNRFLTLACIIMFVIIMISGLRPPRETDELDNHWSAPVLWAQAGKWVNSPYRLTNGPALAEFLYTFSALFSSPIGAHWTHSLLLLVLLFGVASLAQTCGAKPIVAVAICLSTPVIVNQASWAYSDVAAAAFLIAAFVALYSNFEIDSSERGNHSRISVIVTSFLLSGAFSVKTFTLAGFPMALIYTIWRSRLEGRWRLVIQQALRLIIPLMIVAGIWMVHTYSLTGKLLDTRQQHIVSDKNDWFWKTGQAVGHIPSLKDILMLPFVPFYASIFGQREPYGGRTGLLLIPYLLSGCWYLRFLPREQRSKTLWIILAALSYFFLLGPIAIKTRYHIFVWASLSAVAALGYTVLGQAPHSRKAVISSRIFYFLMLLGMTDSFRVLMRGITKIIH